MAFYLYIIYSDKNDKYYIGYTGNLETRIEKHNLGATRSTRSGIPWKQVYYEEFDTKSEAIKRELEIKKKKSRKYIEELIGKKEME